MNDKKFMIALSLATVFALGAGIWLAAMVLIDNSQHIDGSRGSTSGRNTSVSGFRVGQK